MFSPLLVSFTLATMLPAQTCREVVRDSSGRVVQTIERHKQVGGNERAVIRDASGIASNRHHPQPVMQCSWCQFKNECRAWLPGMTVEEIHRQKAA